VIRRSCLGACASCLLPIVVVAVALGVLYHQLTTAPAYAPVAPSPTAQVRAAVAQAVSQARHGRTDVATIRLGDPEVTRLLRLSAGASPFTDLTARVEPGGVLVTGTLTPVQQRVVVSGRFGIRAGIGATIALRPERIGIGLIGLPGVLDHLIAAALPAQLNLSQAAAAGPVQVLCVSAAAALLLVEVRVVGLTGGGAAAGAPICAGPGA